MEFVKFDITLAAELIELTIGVDTQKSSTQYFTSLISGIERPYAQDILNMSPFLTSKLPTTVTFLGATNVN